MSGTRTAQSPAEADSTAKGRLRSTSQAVAGFLKRIPFSITLAVVLVITSIVTNTIFGAEGGETLDTWGAGAITTIDIGEWWTVFTALFIPADGFQLIAGVILVILLLGVAERKMGTVRTILAFLVTGALGIALGVLIQWAGGTIGEWWSVTSGLDTTLDPLTGVVGALVTATAYMSALWRRRVRVMALAFVLVFALYDGDSSNTYRLIAGFVGYLLGAVLTRNPSTLSLRRSSHGETRTLLATIISITAIGPVVALVNGNGLTPFSFGSFLFHDDLPDYATIVAKCDASTAAAVTDACREQLVLVNANGAGSIILSLVPVALLLLAGWGLNNGRRFAMWLAIGVNVAIVLFAQSSFEAAGAAELTTGIDVSFGTIEIIAWLLAAVLLPLVLIVILLVNRRHFQIRAPRGVLGRFWLTVGIAFFGLAALYFAVALLNTALFFPSPTPFDILLDTGRRFIPIHFAINYGTVIVTDQPFLFAFKQFIGVVFWLVFVIAAIILMRAHASSVTVADAQHARQLIRRHGGGTLGFMGTWPGNVYWFSTDGEAAVAYRVINDIAITMSDPIAAPDRAEATIREFTAFCDSNSWTPVFYSVHPQYLPIFESMGWLHMSVGEETLVRTTGLELAGKPWQKVRQALNRGIKEGLTTVWTTWDELPLPTVSAINAISEEWVSEKELPEMGFTLGAMEELKDPEVKLMLAVGPDGAVQAVTSWLPVYRDGKPVGWTIDFMRRTDESMNGVMEFLIASAALHMKEQGDEVLSLSGAPLATKPDGAQAPEQSAVITRVLEFLAKSLEPAYGFSSLFRFKAKFNPEYETISMAYPDALQLPAIGIAIGRAYVPEMSPKEAVALVRTLTK